MPLRCGGAGVCGDGIDHGGYALKDLLPRLPAAKITEIREFTPAAWAKAKVKEKNLVQAA